MEIGEFLITQVGNPDYVFDLPLPQLYAHASLARKRRNEQLYEQMLFTRMAYHSDKKQIQKFAKEVLDG